MQENNKINQCFIIGVGTNYPWLERNGDAKYILMSGSLYVIDGAVYAITSRLQITCYNEITVVVGDKQYKSTIEFQIPEFGLVLMKIPNSHNDIPIEYDFPINYAVPNPDTIYRIRRVVPSKNNLGYAKNKIHATFTGSFINTVDCLPKILLYRFTHVHTTMGMMGSIVVDESNVQVGMVIATGNCYSIVIPQKYIVKFMRDYNIFRHSPAKYIGPKTIPISIDENNLITEQCIVLSNKSRKIKLRVGDVVTKIFNKSICNGTLFDDDLEINLSVQDYATLNMQSESSTTIKILRKGKPITITTEGVKFSGQHILYTVCDYFCPADDYFRELCGVIIVPLTQDLLTKNVDGMLNVNDLNNMIRKKLCFAIVDCIDEEIAVRHNFPFIVSANEPVVGDIHVVKKINGTKIKNLDDIKTLHNNNILLLEVTRNGHTKQINL